MTDPAARLTAALADRYLIERELGQGGMATVLLAQDLRHDRRVAVKVLKPELAAVIGAERFLQEIKVTAHLQHPHILPLFDSGEADGFLFYVMPFIEGESLRDRLSREKQMPVEEAVEITRAVASALDYAHRHKLIHRDIKPENILLHDGQPVVADFGITLAVSVAGGHRITQTGLSLGTPQYMSPEQATADRELDGRTDIYSLGCVLYEMLAGDPPHTGTTVQAVIAKVLTDVPRSVRLSRPSVPAHVEAAVHQALEKLPADRFATATQFAEALEGRMLAVARAGATGSVVDVGASPFSLDRSAERTGGGSRRHRRHRFGWYQTRYSRTSSHTKITACLYRGGISAYRARVDSIGLRVVRQCCRLTDRASAAARRRAGARSFRIHGISPGHKPTLPLFRRRRQLQAQVRPLRAPNSGRGRSHQSRCSPGR